MSAPSALLGPLLIVAGLSSSIAAEEPAKAGRCATPAEALARLSRPDWYPKPEHFADRQCPEGRCDWPPPLGEASLCETVDEQILDGDGRPEIELRCKAGSSEWGSELYASLPTGCWRDLGGWQGKEWEPLASRHHGLVDVSVRSRASSGQVTSRRYQFDGTRYRSVKRDRRAADAP